jgi:carbon-monoxide dehydrogenase medium subunit
VRNFELLEPKSPREASRMLLDHGEEARLLAGGTALLLGLRQRLLTPSHVVYFGAVRGLNGISYDENKGLRIGALARHADVAGSAIVKARYPMLADMAGRIANPQVRSQATLGGNLCYGDPASDPPTCLMALDARVMTVGPDGERAIALENFYIDYYETALRPGEVVTEIQVPPLDNAVGAYTRFLRTPAEHRPLVGLAVVARREGAVCREARITIGASTPFPVRVKRAEQFLEGRKVTAEVVAQAAAIAAQDITPLSDFRGTEDYRREMVRVVLRRTAASVFGLSSN